MSEHHVPPMAGERGVCEPRSDALVRVVVAASVRIYRDGLVQSLRPSVRVVAVTADARSTLEATRRHAPEVVLLDLSMAGGMALVRTLSTAPQWARVVAFAVDEAHDDAVLACAEAGAAEWVGRDASAEAVVEAVRRAARGELLVSTRTAALLSERVATLARERRGSPAAAMAERLTPREAEVGELLTRGLSNKGIAKTLGVQLPTVKNHVHNILEKLDVRSRWEVAAVMREPPSTQ